MKVHLLPTTITVTTTTIAIIATIVQQLVCRLTTSLRQVRLIVVVSTTPMYSLRYLTSHVPMMHYAAYHHHTAIIHLEHGLTAIVIH